MNSRSSGGTREPGHCLVEREGERLDWVVVVKGLVSGPLLLVTELVWEEAGTLLFLGFWFLSGKEEEAGVVPADLVAESFRGVCPGVSTLPFIARSLAAALSAEHLFPRTSGSTGAGGELFSWHLPSCEDRDPEDFLVTLTDEVSLPDSPPVDALALLEACLSVLDAGFFPDLAFPRSFS